MRFGEILREMTQHWQEVYVDGRPVVRTERAGKLLPPQYVYRVMARKEYEEAKQTGFYEPRHGQRIHASEYPRATFGSGIDSVTVRIDYDDADGWQAKWGDQLYVVTDHPIPFSKGLVVAEQDNRP